jgi:hypothetical protein
MKRISFRVPKEIGLAIIKVDDADAHRFKVEYWLARRNKGYLEIYKMDGRVITMLGRELLGIKEDGVCVVHKNDDKTDYRRANLLAIPRKAHTALMSLQSPQTGNPGHKGYKRKFCKRGHLMDDENRIKNGKCSTICKKCHAMRTKRSYEIRRTLEKT